MVNRKKAPVKARTRTVYRYKKRASPRRKSGIPMIPSAMASAALVAANYNGIANAWKYVNSSSSAGLLAGARNLAMGTGSGAKAARAGLIGKDALVKDAIAIGGGYLAGEIVKKYAPGVIKRPAGKLAKKIPKVI